MYYVHWTCRTIINQSNCTTICWTWGFRHTKIALKALNFTLHCNVKVQSQFSIKTQVQLIRRTIYLQMRADVRSKWIICERTSSTLLPVQTGWKPCRRVGRSASDRNPSAGYAARGSAAGSSRSPMESRWEWETVWCARWVSEETRQRVPIGRSEPKRGH